MMFDTSAYYGQASVLPSPFAPHGPFGYLPGQYGHLGGQGIGGWPGHPQLAAFTPQGVLGNLSGQYGQPMWPAIGGGLGHPQFSGFQPIWQGIAGGLGHPQLAAPLAFGVGPFGRLLPFDVTGLTMPAPLFAPPGLFAPYGPQAMGGWLGHPQFAGLVGRSILPHPVVPQMAYAG